MYHRSVFHLDSHSLVVQFHQKTGNSGGDVNRLRNPNVVGHEGWKRGCLLGLGARYMVMSIDETETITHRTSFMFERACVGLQGNTGIVVRSVVAVAYDEQNTRKRSSNE
jgi:hypothetical protein